MTLTDLKPYLNLTSFDDLSPTPEALRLFGFWVSQLRMNDCEMKTIDEFAEHCERSSQWLTAIESGLIRPSTLSLEHMRDTAQDRLKDEWTPATAFQELCANPWGELATRLRRDIEKLPSSQAVTVANPPGAATTTSTSNGISVIADSIPYSDRYLSNANCRFFERV